MRSLLLSLTALAVAAPGAAWAADGCPDKITPAVVTALGDPAATLPGGQAIYQPAGATVLGMPVGYVVVTKASGKDVIEEIDYRFSGVMRKFTEHYPKPVLEAFDKTYSGASCASGRSTACAVAFQTDGKASTVGRLSAVEVGDPGLDVPANAQAAILSTVKADYASSDSGPVFLVCLYDAG